MAASAESPRRRRYVRQPVASPALTPKKVALLRYVGDLGVSSLPQLARIGGVSDKSARRHLRELFDGGLVKVVPVGRYELAGREEGNSAALLFGSAPNVYVLTPGGGAALEELGIEVRRREDPRYGPRNSLFLGHALAVTEVRVWLEVAARMHPPHRLERWTDGKAAEIELLQPGAARAVRPDSWFVYRLGERVLVGLLEADRGTERGAGRWKEKVAAYSALFSGGRLREACGYANARVLVVAPTARRRDFLAAFVAREAGAVAQRFWFADRSVLSSDDLSLAAWRKPGSDRLLPLIPRELLGPPPVSRT